MPKADTSTDQGWRAPNLPAWMVDPTLYARRLLSAPIVEKTNSVTKVTLEVSDRIAVKGGPPYRDGKSPGGTVVCWRATAELVKHLAEGDSIVIQPLEIRQFRYSWEKNLPAYQKRIDVDYVFWMSRPPP
jgi:hypothetical protein